MKSRSASSTDEPQTAATTAAVVGRFAPSPTGPLHLGSLLTAVASHVHARSAGGRWLLRIEDLDVQRCVPGATDAILRTLDRHALHWDDAATYQRQRIARYRDAIERLDAGGHTYACTCSRSQLRSSVYPGTCRDRRAISDEPHSIRVKVPAETWQVHDAVQGTFAQRLDVDVGDFVILRRDGVVAYQLAVVVDDIDQEITHVVRGADLLDNTPRQLLLFARLRGAAPQYAHIPVLVDRSGQKLSKQTFARAVDAAQPSANLTLILTLLGHEPPRELRAAGAGELIAWATAAWDLTRVPRGLCFSGFVCI
jgi:glutamyl-Q tRNA(Asp) synthetase